MFYALGYAQKVSPANNGVAPYTLAKHSLRDANTPQSSIAIASPICCFTESINIFANISRLPSHFWKEENDGLCLASSSAGI